VCLLRLGLEGGMDEKYASLLRFVILGVAAAAHNYAVTPPSSEESYLMDSGRLVEGQGVATVIRKGRGGEIEEKPSEDVLHEKSITLLQLGLRLCNLSRYAVWGLVALEGTARVLSLFPTSELSTNVLPILLPSFSTFRPQTFPPSTSNSFLTLTSGPNWIFVLSAATVFVGASIRGACFHTLKRLYTFSHTTLNGHSLVKTGPYSIVRHPGYVGAVLVRGGMICLLISSGGLADAAGAVSLKSSPLLPWLSDSVGGMFSSALRAGLGLFTGYAISEQTWLLSRSWREDETLHEKFGAEWEEYQRNVPSRFIPFIF